MRPPSPASRNNARISKTRSNIQALLRQNLPCSRVKEPFRPYAHQKGTQHNSGCAFQLHSLALIQSTQKRVHQWLLKYKGGILHREVTSKICVPCLFDGPTSTPSTDDQTTPLRWILLLFRRLRWIRQRLRLFFNCNNN